MTYDIFTFTIKKFIHPICLKIQFTKGNKLFNIQINREMMDFNNKILVIGLR